MVVAATDCPPYPVIVFASVMEVPPITTFVCNTLVAEVDIVPPCAAIPL